MENIITFASMTHAMKARDVLRGRGISSRLIRTPARLRRGSCGYSLVIPKRYDQACRIIRDHGLPYREMHGGDAL